MQQKIASLRENAGKEHPDRKPVDITEAEANAYFNEGGVKLPKGVTRVQLAAKPGVIEGHATVDFDAITQKARSSNPLLSVFSGQHDVKVTAQALGTNGQGTIRVQSVYVDNIEVPEMALQFFVERYITPKYPNVGMTSTFKLPLRIDSATVGNGNVTVTQK